jgi:catechol 2,3-dioxygenase-like lactoylglutathione lyase family enzyme
MINGGLPTLYVSDMDRAVRFYSETLGLELKARYGDHWAEVDAGEGFVLGLHPQRRDAPAAQEAGSISIGFNVDEPLDGIVALLEGRGVKFHGPIRDDEQAGIRLVGFRDPDGNDLYFCERTGRA